jgi:hypothetical protein
LARWVSWRGFALALIAFSLFGWGFSSLAERRARASSPTGEAEWIWQNRYHRDVSPAAFLAARDFFLESVPSRARLLVAADEEYVLTLNNRPVGRGGSPYRGVPDAYEVAPLLLPGGNRFVVDLRNGRGPGGFLLCLEDPATRRPLVVSDGDWRIFPRWVFGLERGWLPLEDGEAPRIWGIPPLGRWGKLGTPVAKPLGIGFAGSSLAPIGSKRVALAPLPGGEPVPGAAVLLDWGREVTGYLALELAVPQELAIGLLWVGETPPDPYLARPAGTILLRPGRGSWADAHPRRFRYALVVGLGAPASALVTPLSGALGEGPPAAAPDLDFSVAKIEAQGGAFGVVPPPSRTPVEDEVWRKLQRLAGVGGGKEL